MTRWGPYRSAHDFVEQWLFDEERYAGVAGVPAAQAWEHFLAEGQYADLSPSPFLDVRYVRRILRLTGSAPTADLFEAWEALGGSFTPTPLIDPVHYWLRHPDVRDQGMDASVHWLMFGMFEGRPSAPFFTPTPLWDRHAPEAERRAALHRVDDLLSYLLAHSARSSLNARALVGAYPGSRDVLTDCFEWNLPFCTDPQILFGSLRDFLLEQPDRLGRMGMA